MNRELPRFAMYGIHRVEILGAGHFPDSVRVRLIEAKPETYPYLELYIHELTFTV